MRIGFDVDGVLANFAEGYQRLVVEISGEDKFPKGVSDDPPTWNWPQHFGYDDKLIGFVWDYIKLNPGFWGTLNPFPVTPALRNLSNYSHDIYFITDRPGQGAHAITGGWLENHIGSQPAVIISRKGKGIVADALDLDLYIDDKVENILDVQEAAPTVRTYLAPQKAYNTNHPQFGEVIRTRSTVEQVLREEHLI